jgi:hypothetical protein
MTDSVVHRFEERFSAKNQLTQHQNNRDGFQIKHFGPFSRVSSRFYVWTIHMITNRNEQMAKRPRHSGFGYLLELNNSIYSYWNSKGV